MRPPAGFPAGPARAQGAGERATSSPNGVREGRARAARRRSTRRAEASEATVPTLEPTSPSLQQRLRRGRASTQPASAIRRARGGRGASASTAAPRQAARVRRAAAADRGARTADGGARAREPARPRTPSAGACSDGRAGIARDLAERLQAVQRQLAQAARRTSHRSGRGQPLRGRAGAAA